MQQLLFQSLSRIKGEMHTILHIKIENKQLSTEFQNLLVQPKALAYTNEHQENSHSREIFIKIRNPSAFVNCVFCKCAINLG